MKKNKILTLLIVLFCTTSLSAQYKLDIVYSMHDRELISYTPPTTIQAPDGNFITAPTRSGMLRMPITINEDGSVMLPKKIDNPITFNDLISNQVANFRFTEGYSTEGILTINFTSPGDQIENIEFPAIQDEKNVVYITYFAIFGDTPMSSAKQAITLNTTKTLLKTAEARLATYNEPNVWPYGKNNKQDIYNFINNGTLFPFEYLLNKDSKELVVELVKSNSNPTTSQSIELLYKIQQLLFYNYNSRVLKLALQDIDKSGYDWQGAVNNKVWGNNPRSLIIPKHKQSWESLMEFITETLPSNPEAVIVEEVLKSFTDRYGGNEYKQYGDFRSWDWGRWIKMCLYDGFEKEFIEKFEKYKIVGYPNDSKEEVSELIGCAMLRANLIAYKNSQTIFEPYILQFMRDSKKFDVTARQESEAVYKKQTQENGYGGYEAGGAFEQDFRSLLEKNENIKRLVSKKGNNLKIRFKIS